MQGRRVSDIVTSHSIVGESFTELIDHDEEDAQRIPEAALTNRKSGTEIYSPLVHICK